MAVVDTNPRRTSASWKVPTPLFDWPDLSADPHNLCANFSLKKEPPLPTMPFPTDVAPAADESTHGTTEVAVMTYATTACTAIQPVPMAGDGWSKLDAVLGQLKELMEQQMAKAVLVAMAQAAGPPKPAVVPAPPPAWSLAAYVDELSAYDYGAAVHSDQAWASNRTTPTAGDTPSIAASATAALERTLEILGPNGEHWTRGHFGWNAARGLNVQGASDSATHRCVMGALERAIHLMVAEGLPWGFAVFMEARRRLVLLAHGAPQTYNDSHDFAAVQDLVQRAIGRPPAVSVPTA